MMIKNIIKRINEKDIDPPVKDIVAFPFPEI